MDVPSGTVTFLFTDIEGSTRMAREHSERWETLRARHHEILRTAIEANHGYVFQIIGDAFCASFHKAADALKAAVQAQQHLQKEPWGDAFVRVRMGIHTGEAETDGIDYRGYLTMSMVQRLMSAGHGGQILVSSSTESLLHGQLPTDIYLQDLGQHHFKDIPQPERIFQVIMPGFQKDFPPIRTIDHHPNNLPPQLTSFVGRQKERAEIRKLLQHAHMLTLIGPGGTGKTRLSIQAASEMLDSFPDGVWLVELAPILDPQLVPRITATAIGLRDEPQRPVIDMLCDYLHDRKTLILLDNCEHLVDACAHMADRILHAAPDVLILASSREALGIGGEVTYRVPSLELPDLSHLPPFETLDQYAAVRLFIDRAGSADPSFTVNNQNAPAIAQICHRLDGIPLAIELAAAKIRVLSAEQISRRLDDRLKLLTGGSRTAVERHQTLRATIDWSYNLLPPAEQVLFRRLSIFIGGWTLEAAEGVCSGDPLARDDVLDLMEHLIHKSLVFREENRYRMLETLRQYANEKLVEAGEGNILRDRHLQYFLEMAETAEPHLIRPEQLEWLALLDADYENLRLAIEWALNQEPAEPSLRLCAALGSYWDLRNTWLEGGRALARALAKPVQENGSRERKAYVKALYRDALLADKLDELDRLEHSSLLSLELAEQGTSELDRAIARTCVGLSLYRRGNHEEASAHLEKSLKDFERQNQPYWQAFTYDLLSRILIDQGKLKRQEAIPISMELARNSGERMTLALATLNVAFLQYLQEELEACSRSVEQAKTLYQQLGLEMMTATNLEAGVAFLSGDLEKTKTLLIELQERMRILGEKSSRAWQFMLLCELAIRSGELDQALGYLDEAIALCHEIGEVDYLPYCLFYQCKIENIRGNSQKFKQIVQECISLVRDRVMFIKIQLLVGFTSCPYFQEPENSLPILGFLDFTYKQLGVPIDPFIRHDYDQAVAKARAALGDAAFEAACVEGENLSIDDALDLVLQSVDKL